VIHPAHNTDAAGKGKTRKYQRENCCTLKLLKIAFASVTRDGLEMHVK
jgi:hypothetical protein